MADTPHVAVVARAAGKTNGVMVERWRQLGIDASLLTPEAAVAALRESDVALVRLDVLRSLDGIEPGLDMLPILEQRGVRILNSADTLVRAHDKLQSARALCEAGVPTPAWSHLGPDAPRSDMTPPLVMKPRFGSWGRDVVLCQTADELERALVRARVKPWYRRQGAMIETYLPAAGVDRRVLVAAGEVVGRAERVAAPGEWRTNVSLGGSIRAAGQEPDADALAIAAAAAIDADFVGVDLIRSGARWFVVELNGAVDFDAQYSLPTEDVFSRIARALGLLALGQPVNLTEPAGAR